MKQREQRETAARQVYELYWESYLNGDESAFASTLDENFEMIGTSETEIAHGKSEGLEFFNAQVREIGGKAALRNRKIQTVQVEDLILFIELADIYLLVENDWNFYSGIRLSTFLRETASGWKVIQQHGSFPDTRVQEGETIAFEKISKENQELREAVKRRTIDLENKNRELEIEASLERVRAVAMGMKKPDDMLEVCHIISQQCENLGINEIRNVQTAIIYENKGTYLNYEYYAKHEKLLVTEVDFKNHGLQTMFAHRMLQGAEELFSESLTGKEVKDWYDYQKTTNQFADSFLENAQSLNYYFYSLGPVALGISTYAPLTEEEINLFKRFRNVFDLAYRRFLDIQNAEAQAREAQIEAALERVRSRSMAMHLTSDLQDVINTVYQQFRILDIDISGGAFIAINEENKNEFSCWGAGGSAAYAERVSIPFIDSPIYTGLIDFIRKGTGFLAEEFSFGEKIEFFNHLFNQPPYSEVSPERKNEILSRQGGYTRSCVVSKYTSVFMINHHGKKFTEDENNILIRFGNVFEQTYTRFLDLQKAEEQARDAQIEGSLERVRSKTMAMRSSQDVGDTVAVMFDELVRLGIETVRCGIGILFESMQMEAWTAKSEEEGKATLIIGRLGLSIHPLLQEVYKSWIKGDQSYSYELRGEDLKDYFRAINNSEDYPVEYDIGSLPTSQFQNAFFFAEGAIFAFTDKPMEAEASMIFKRFAGVFGQTYTRFLDLQKAERQARESIKQSSLDRVRGQIASMRTAHDLENITPIIWKELKILDVPFIRCGVFFVDNDQSNVRVYLTTPDVKPLGVLSLPIESGALTSIAVDYWRKGLVYNEHWNRDQFVRWTQSMLELGQIQNKETYQGSENPPEALDLYFVPFTQGMLYLGNTSPLSEETIQLVKSLADAFSIAYARYEDFNKLEKVKESIETTLTELKSAQALLIQSEKMASLGELTAGIAHEIQNPLNFVNNFSEVSNELIDEMREELAKGTEVSVQLANEIAEDIKSNLGKITLHGKRADAIVKGMLHHSRSGSGVKEPTDINALFDEYLRLAYHGLRAKDSSFNATMKTGFDEKIGNINIIPQDIGRVLLNLITNAFYAVTEKYAATRITGDAELKYEPEVSVSTRIINGRIELRVTDNGNGIPAGLLDKIFQPFFTTKPTGQGTGLGLSLSYDIVKAHGGELKVETSAGEGSSFIVYLPV
ncbi:MAG: ATP-binding protein [Lentimicrobium sp.]